MKTLALLTTKIWSNAAENEKAPINVEAPMS